LETKDEVKDVILIGGGPSCNAAAIQLSRAGINILQITEDIGGLIKNANLIENLLGFPDGISGERYVELMKKQLKKYDVQTVFERVKLLELNEPVFRVKTENNEYLARYVIVGSGTVPKKLNILGEEETFEEKKLFYDVYDLKPIAEEKEIIIVGGGDAAYDYALNLVQRVKSIEIIQRSEKAKSIPILQRRIKEQTKIRIRKRYIPLEITTTETKTRLITEVNKVKKELTADYILVAIGRKSNISFLSPELKRVYKKQKSESKIFFIGDVKNSNFRQVSIAIGDGLKAAMRITEEILSREEHGNNRKIW